MEMDVSPSVSSTDKYTVQVFTKYMCRYCAKQFDNVRDMQVHVASHKRSTAPYSCSICERIYRTSSKLQRHVRVHSGERPYVCNLCGRRFTRSDHVKQHMKVHMSLRQKNICRICNARFMKTHFLGVHLRSHGIAQVHMCRRCGEGFQNADEFENHKKLHDTKGNLCANRKGKKVSISSDIENDDSQDPGKKGSLNGKWLGCARFCIAQLPAKNKVLEDSVTYETSCELKNENETTETNHESAPEAIETVEDYSGLDAAAAACYSLVDLNNGANETESIVAETITDGTKMFVLPSADENGIAELNEQGSKNVASGLKALIKKEPGMLDLKDKNYTVSLLNKNSLLLNHFAKQPLNPIQRDILIPAEIGEKKVSKCDYCGIWFEDHAMYMLHNSLHSADITDPFTCKKCMKRLGNRLEFTAHLVWHLDPECQ